VADLTRQPSGGSPLVNASDPEAPSVWT
jgi:hypothetical protein